MEERVVESVGKLCGTVPVSGAKNSSLLLLAASVLCEKAYVLDQMPRISDVEKMREILLFLNIKSRWVGQNALFIDPSEAKNRALTSSMCAEVRTSVLFLGALLGRFKQASVGIPGGCNLGPRPIDYHLKAMGELGAKVNANARGVSASLEKEQDAEICFERPTVTGTANVILAAVSLNAKTVILGAVLEPEIDDLIAFLQQSGADVARDGSTITVCGGKRLQGSHYTVMPDRIEAGTYLIATAILGGDVTISGIKPIYLHEVLECLRKVGANIEEGGKAIRIQMASRPKALDIVAREYPGFPTDLQPQWCVLSALSDGSSMIKDTVFPSRFDHMAELKKLGIRYREIEGGVVIEGVDSIEGQTLYARNLRSAAALVLGGMAASGKSKVLNITELNRGYPDFFLKINNILSY